MNQRRIKSQKKMESMRMIASRSRGLGLSQSPDPVRDRSPILGHVPHLGLGLAPGPKHASSKKALFLLR